MKRIDDRTVEYESDAEWVIVEIHDLLMARGMSQSEAMIILRGADLPPGIREVEKTPHLDKILTPEFVDWLCE